MLNVEHHYGSIIVVVAIYFSSSFFESWKSPLLIQKMAVVSNDESLAFRECGITDATPGCYPFILEVEKLAQGLVRS